MRAALCVTALCWACGDNTAPGADPLPLPGPGSLVAESGRGTFRLGTASAATQIEDQNPAVDWNVFTRPVDQGGLGKGEYIADAARGYSLAASDLALIGGLGLDSYRFSIEWARVEPSRDVIDEAALDHYRTLLLDLRARGIRPVVTVHHFSNPTWIADPRDPTCTGGVSDTNLCGLGHPTGGPLVVAEMEAHARLLATRLGDLVDDWGTLNEPVNYLLAAYGTGTFPPGRVTVLELRDQFMPIARDYLEAHASMYRAIKEADQTDADGDGLAAAVGLSLLVADWVPAARGRPSTDPGDVAARDRLVAVVHYLFADAVTTGMFDADLDGVAEEAHPGWVGTRDWLGLQYYFRAGVTGTQALIPELGLTPCLGEFGFGTACIDAADPTFCVPSMGYEAWPSGLTALLEAFAARYPGLPLVVTEAGIATRVGARRAEIIVRTLEAIEAARAGGADVRGFYYWSLTDNFEWAEGFVPRFGLFTVDYATYTRTATEGADVLGAIAQSRQVSAEQRARYGGTGPMTPEPGHSGSVQCTNDE